MTMDPDSYRAVLGRFASGVTVVTATDDAGRTHGMTVSAFCSLSLAPPLVLACIDRQASMHDLLGVDRAFAINILSEGQEAVSRRFSADDPPNRFDGLGYTRGQTGAPVLDDVLAWVECRVRARHDGGDHTILVGHVETAAVRPERPLLYYRGGYAALER